MLLPITLSVWLFVAQVVADTANSNTERKIKSKIDTFNVLANCWGRENVLKVHQWVHEACQYCAQMPTPAGPLYLEGGAQSPVVVNTAAYPPVITTGALPPQFRTVQSAAVATGAASHPLLLNTAAASVGTGGLPWTNAYSNGGSYYGRRKKRQVFSAFSAGSLEFLSNVDSFLGGVETKFGNLSCVMTQLNMLDGRGNINLAKYTDEIWRYLGNSGAAADPLFREKMTNGFRDCYTISQTWPQEALDRNPITRVYGRHMIFFECAKKQEHKLCYKYQAKQWVEIMYGPIDQAVYGLPGDKYDAAAAALKAMYENSSEEMKFVDEKMWGESNFL